MTGIVTFRCKHHAEIISRHTACILMPRLLAIRSARTGTSSRYLRKRVRGTYIPVAIRSTGKARGGMGSGGEKWGTRGRSCARRVRTHYTSRRDRGFWWRPKLTKRDVWRLAGIIVHRTQRTAIISNQLNVSSPAEPSLPGCGPAAVMSYCCLSSEKLQICCFHPCY